MLIGAGVILLAGIIANIVFSKIKLPPLIGMLLAGILLGPYMLDMIGETVLSASADIRRAALVVILLRAGLALDVRDLKKVGRPALLMCFAPALFEITGMLFLAPLIFGTTLLEGAIIGAVVAAVSPAVIVPRMLRLMQEGYGTKKNIPQLVMAGASVDDVLVIVLFTSFISLAGGQATGAGAAVFSILVSIVLGAATGFALGAVLAKALKAGKNKTLNMFILLAAALLLAGAEPFIQQVVPFSGLLAVVALGMGVLYFAPQQAKDTSAPFSKIWTGAEIFLFVLVGAQVDIHYLAFSGFKAVLLLLGGLLFRSAGVLVSLLKTNLNAKERLFCVLSYLPKATVQAAIGGIPLAMGLACGNMVLTVAVVAILFTAPLGAVAIDKTYKKLLAKNK